MGAKSWLDALLAFFYPNVCQLCGAQRAESKDGFVCMQCRSGSEGVVWVDPPFCSRCGLPFPGAITTEFECSNCKEMDLKFESARAAVAATRNVREAIHRYKYGRALWIEPFLAEQLLARALPELRDDPCDAILPVPLHPVKQREREFNQAERLGKILSEATGIPLRTDLLKRDTYTTTQTSLSREKRLENVKRAFSCRRPEEIKGRSFVVVDDILTTGATTSACAGVLHKAGAARVRVWTLARATREQN